MPPVDVETLRAIGVANGLTELGTCAVRALGHTRQVLESRRAEGLHDTMAFTYRNPARSTEPGRILRDARSIVVGAWPYASIPPASLRPRARVARYAAEDHYLAMRGALTAVALELRSAGHRAVVVADENSLVDREVAWRAGLGFYGKNANLLLSGGRGSWFVLGAVVTTADVGPVGRPVAEECGACRRCIDGCPTGAIVAPGVVDARRCISWALQAPGSIEPWMRRAIGDRIYGCDDCQEVCPPSRRNEVAAGPAERPDRHLIDPVAWLALSDEALMAIVDRWYVPGRDPGVVRRNLLVILGNSGRGDLADVASAITAHLVHSDRVVVEAASWAATELGRSDLAAGVSSGQDGRA